MKLSLLGVAAFAAVSVTASEHVANFKYKPREDPVPNEKKSQGCFLSQGSLKKVPITQKDENGVTLVVTVGVCLNQCATAKKDVMAVHGTDCLCGDTYPPKEKRTDDKKCDTACFGFKEEPCGNIGDYDAWSVYNMGVVMDVKFDDLPTTTSAAPTTSKTASDDTESEATSKPSTGTESNAPNTSDETKNDKEEKKDGPNVAGIAAGVVVGVVVIAAVVGGGFFFLRRRRNAEIEEEHRRNAAVNAFISGAKPPNSSGGLSMSDSRLEPGLAHRRLSDGSIADNQDYSRKILRVTNA